MTAPTFVVVVEVPERADRFYVFAEPEDADAFTGTLTARGHYSTQHREPVFNHDATVLLIQAELAD